MGKWGIMEIQQEKKYKWYLTLYDVWVLEKHKILKMSWINKYLGKRYANIHDGSWETYMMLGKLYWRNWQTNWTVTRTFAGSAKKFPFLENYTITTVSMRVTRWHKISFFRNLCNVRILRQNLYQCEENNTENLDEKEFLNVTLKEKWVTYDIKF